MLQNYLNHCAGPEGFQLLQSYLNHCGGPEGVQLLQSYTMALVPKFSCYKVVSTILLVPKVELRWHVRFERGVCRTNTLTFY